MFNGLSRLSKTHGIIESVAIPIPLVEELHTSTVLLGPLVTIGEWSVESKDDNRECQEYGGCAHANDWLVLECQGANGDAAEVVVKDLCQCNDGEVESREVVVQEELALHEEEGKVVESPAKDDSADFVVKATEGEILVVIAAPLPSEERETFEGNVDGNGRSASPPDQRVADEIDLTMILAPEVDATLEDRP